MSLHFPLRVKAVMIDLDGTLLDTIPDLAAAANLMLGELGRPALEEALIRTFVGKGIPNLVERSLAGSLTGAVEPALFERALPIFERCYAGVNGSRTTIYPGVKEGLDRLREQGFPLACVTNKAGSFTLPLTHTCAKFGIAPREMLMIGDSLNDAQAARAAGCPVFCVPYGYNEGRDVRELDIDAIVTSLLDATRLIQKA